jgi:FemAB-related protein (PEP-CTERM system-associated)
MPVTDIAPEAVVSVVGGSVADVQILAGKDLTQSLPRLEAYLERRGRAALSLHPAWCSVLRYGLKHRPYCLEAVEQGRTRGFLALAYVRSLLFGRFLVSMPYLNYGGVIADDDAVAIRLIDRAVELADQLNVRYLQLRHEAAIHHQFLRDKTTAKVNMRLALPDSADELWKVIPSKVRNQVRKAEKAELDVVWGGAELLGEFYDVFSRNMRDLGTPVYSRRLFGGILRHFPKRAEFCVVRRDGLAVAAALLLHGYGVTEVPSASSLREHNSTCANMLMYWRLLERAIERGQGLFDFGRCGADSNTYRFKKQWGAEPSGTEWQYYVRRGEFGEMTPHNPRYAAHVRRWQRLPLWLTRLAGPWIVRGIP